MFYGVGDDPAGRSFAISCSTNVDDRRLLHGSSTARTWTTAANDDVHVVGTLLDMDRGTVSYYMRTISGSKLSLEGHDVTFGPKGAYPCVSVLMNNEATINFGFSSFLINEKLGTVKKVKGKVRH